MTKSESIIKFSPAFLKAQEGISSVLKTNQAKIPTKTGGSYTYNYADLGSVIEACKKGLNDNKIMVIQPVNGDKVQTVLIHESGEWIADDGVEIKNARENDPQAQGSAITYARRYGLQSMVLLPAEEDDDAQKAMPQTNYNTSKTTSKSEYGQCPKCGKDLELKTTKTGRSMIKCTGGGWDPISKKAIGCDYVDWMNGEGDRSNSDVDRGDNVSREEPDF